MGKKLLYGFLLVVPAYSATESATQARWLEGMEQAHYDLWHQLAGRRYKPQHVVIVTIDDQTSREHADEPLVFWAPHFARVLEVLHQVGAKFLAIWVPAALGATADVGLITGLTGEVSYWNKTEEG